jgi:hypothetical protein
MARHDRCITWTTVLLGILCPLCHCSPGPDTNDPNGDGGGSRFCQQDTHDGPETAGTLAAGTGNDEWTAEGYICPVGDQDWYKLTVPAGHHLLRVGLDVTGPGSPIQPTYAVYGPPCDEACLDLEPQQRLDQGCCQARATPRPEEVGGRLDVDHCLEPGEYFVTVREQGNDAQDFRSPRGLYHLTLSTAPDSDSNEPNDGPDSASTLTGTTANGHITCRGDQDWYAIEGVGNNELLQVRLQVPIAEFQPQLRVVAADGSQIGSISNPAGTVEQTDLDGLYALPSGGRYFVVVEDDDGSEADVNATYQLTVTTVTDTDTNEYNNTAATATDLGNLSCGSSWSTVNATGTLAATNDVDIYRVSLAAGCAGGVFEAAVELNGTPPENLQPSVRIVRAHPESPCTDDYDCRTLSMTCDPGENGLDCAGFGNSCLVDACAGASMCLPGGVCGATVIERHPDFCHHSDGRCRGPGSTRLQQSCSNDSDCANQAEVHTAIPLGRNPNPSEITAIDQLFVVVSDYQNDEASPNRYSLTLRARNDPDPNEPNEVYNPWLSQDLNPNGRDMAVNASWGSCVTGRISYEYDQDWFELPHPCPSSRCTIRIRSTLQGGRVDFRGRIDTWGDFLVPESSDDNDNNGAIDETFGGNNRCAPADRRSPDRYFVVIRDQVPVRDYEPGQSYNICFFADAGCTSPCEPRGEDLCNFAEAP